MENNEQETTEEVVDTASDAEQIETQEDGQEETIESLKGQVAKFKAIADRKEKKLQEKPNKTNTEQTSLSREDTIFFAQGGTEETYAIAKKIADQEGISVLAAKEDDYFKFKVDQLAQEAKVKANQLGASGGSPTSSGHQAKPIGEMTREEHMAHMKTIVPDIR